MDSLADISDECQEGRKITTYLTTGMGQSDMYAAVIAKKHTNCTIRFLANENYYIIVVIEFLDWYDGRSHCGSKDNKVQVLIRNRKSKRNICTEPEGNIFRDLNKHRIGVKVEGELQTIKITATSLKVSKGGQCRKGTIKCMFNNQGYCMTSLARCDGNVNCGIRNKYDENQVDCNPYNAVNPIMICAGLIIVLATFCLLTALLKKLVPNREGTFIIKQDETLSERDRATSEKEFKVLVKILQAESDEFSRGAELDTIREESYHGTTNPKLSLRKSKGRMKKSIDS